MQTQFVAKKLYYRIGEVCDIIGVEAHVLRYWETEFPSLAPPKNKAGQRIYRAKDIELLLAIRNLLYNEGYTIAGARKQLARTARPAAEAAPAVAGVAATARPPAVSAQMPAATPTAAPAQRLNLVREELENILTLLERE